MGVPEEQLLLNHGDRGTRRDSAPDGTICHLEGLVVGWFDSVSIQSEMEKFWCRDKNGMPFSHMAIQSLVVGHVVGPVVDHDAMPRALRVM